VKTSTLDWVVAALGALFMATGVAALVGGTVWMPILAVMVPCLLWIVVSPERAAHRGPLGPANRLTLFRGVMVALLAAFLFEPQADAYALWLAGGAALSVAADGLDGQVARQTNGTTPLGARMDGELDAILTVILSALAWQLDRAGAWVLLCGGFRYAFLVAGWLLPALRAPLPDAPSRAWACGASLGALVIALVPWGSPVIATVACGVAVGVLSASYVRDVGGLLWGRNRLDRADGQPAA